MGGMAGMGSMGGMAGMGGMGCMGLGALEESMEGQVHQWEAWEAWEHWRLSMEPWEHHRGDSWPPWSLYYLLQVMVPMKKQKMEMTLMMWMSDDVFAFVICKFVLNFVV
jgi:hypothetical protein